MRPGGGAVDAPLGVGDGAGDLDFHSADGAEVLDDGVGEALVRFGLFGSHDENLTGEAVGVSVEAGDAFAGVGARSGRFCRVAAVGCDLSG